MTDRMPEIDKLAAAARSALAGANLLVGDNLAPKDGGWQEGTPGKNVFRPYVVLMQGPSTPSTPDRIVPDHSEWMVNFSLRSYAGSVPTLESTVRTARNAIVEMDRLDFGDATVFRIVHVHPDQLGSIVRDDSVQPPYWQTFDAIRFEISRTRNQP